MLFDTASLAQHWEHYNDRFNPMRGLDMRRLSGIFADAEEGRYAELQFLNRLVGKREPLVRAVNRRMKGAIKKLSWSIGSRPEEELDAAERKLAARQAAFLKARYEAVTNIYDALIFLASADFKGFSHLEEGDLGAGKTALVPVPQYHWYRKGLYGTWEYNATADSWPRNTVPLDEDLRKRLIIREVEDPACEIFATAFLRKNFASKDWDGFIENWGIPWIFLVMPPGLSAEQQTEWQGVANRMIGDGRGTLPAGSDVKTADAANRGTSPFVEYLRRQDEDIVLTATGGLLTMLNANTGLGGSQGKEHGDAWDEIVAGTARDLEECFQKERDARLLEAEFGRGVPVLAWFQLSRPELRQSPEKVAATVKTLGEAGFAADRGWVEENSGVKLAEVEAVAKAGNAQLIKHRGVLEDILTETAAEAIEVPAEWLAKLRPGFDHLLKVIENKKATQADFTRAAAALERMLPELLHGDGTAKLAEVLERAMSEAAVAGAVEARANRANK